MSESLKNLSELSDAKLAELVKSGNDSAFDVLTLRYLRNIGFLAKKYSQAYCNLQKRIYESSPHLQEGHKHRLRRLYGNRTVDDSL